MFTHMNVDGFYELYCIINKVSCKLSSDPIALAYHLPPLLTIGCLSYLPFSDPLNLYLPTSLPDFSELGGIFDSSSTSLVGGGGRRLCQKPAIIVCPRFTYSSLEQVSLFHTRVGAGWASLLQTTVFLGVFY